MVANYCVTTAKTCDSKIALHYLQQQKNCRACVMAADYCVTTANTCDAKNSLRCLQQQNQFAELAFFFCRLLRRNGKNSWCHCIAKQTKTQRIDNTTTEACVSICAYASPHCTRELQSQCTALYTTTTPICRACVMAAIYCVTTAKTWHAKISLHCLQQQHQFAGLAS